MLDAISLARQRIAVREFKPLVIVEDKKLTKKRADSRLYHERHKNEPEYKKRRAISRAKYRQSETYKQRHAEEQRAYRLRKKLQGV